MIYLKDTKNQFIAGALNKSEYIKKMYDLHHSHLFDYASYMNATDIESILIGDGKIIMTSKKYGVHMLCPESDHGVVPMESLNFGSMKT